MVHIRYLSLTGGLLLLLVVAGCAIPSTTTPARVEDRSLPRDQEVPAEATPEIPEPSTPDDTRRPDESIKTEQPAAVTEAEDVTASGKVGDTEKTYQTGPAVVALLDDADRYSGLGDNQQAIASVERALRIEPKNPVLWNKLGRLHLQNGSWVQAITMAKKSNVHVGGDQSLQADNWQIIGRARQGLGDSAGADEAYKKAQQLGR